MATKGSHIYRRLVHVALFAALLLCGHTLNAQCVTVYPYKEGFEASNGNWTTGGTSSDWAWGTPSKSVINTAGEGQKCWITGGLAKIAYNPGENAWLQTPCFDFTNIPHPYISFKVFWETEYNYDGASLEYSTNGVNWVKAGSSNDATNCLNGNWFNTLNIRYVPGNGWSGSQSGTSGCGSGNGSGGWVTANHTFPSLAGLPNVQFRFLFGAGTTCNNYNGFAVDDFFIGEAPANDASFTYTCTGGNNVTFTNTSPGCPASSWNFGDPGSAANNTSTATNPTHKFNQPGQYSVTLTVTGPDNAPSTITETINIMKLTPRTLADALCNGSKEGSVSVTVANAGSNTAYSWNTDPVQTAQTISNLGAGGYTVTVTADKTCPSQTTATVLEPVALETTYVTVLPTCGNSDGRIVLTTSAGSAPYTYEWSPNVSSSFVGANLDAGDYTITITDRNLCTDIVKVPLADPQGLVATISNTKDVSCNGLKDGTATVTVTGGATPYQYTWSPAGGNTATGINLAAGDYTVTVKDNNGCTSKATAKVKEPSALTTTVTAQDAACGNSNGTASVTVSGGVSPYTYLWSPGGFTTAAINNLGGGDYTIKVTDKNGCIANDKATVNAGGTMTLQLSHTDLKCFNDKNGTASVTVTGGTPGYTYTWTDGTNTYTGASITGLGAGTFTVTVKDAAGCSSTNAVDILQPQVLGLVLSAHDALCNNSGGKIESLADGGSQPYAYSWTPGGATTSNLTNLSPGDYTLNLTDNNGCKASASVSIHEPLALTTATTANSTTCGGNNGSASVTAGGGTLPYTYAWMPGNYTTSTINNVAANNYTVTVTDKNGCIANDAAVITATNGIIIQPDHTDVQCFGGKDGSASLAISGGSPAYTVTWSNGSSNNPLMNISAGSYIATVKDIAGCTATSTINVTQPLELTLALSQVRAICNNSNGKALSTVAGGIQPYNYAWVPVAANTPNLINVFPGSYTLTVTDKNGCTKKGSVLVGNSNPLKVSLGNDTSICINSSDHLLLSPGNYKTYTWQNGSKNSTFDVTQAGNYWVAVTDEQGCTAGDTIRIKDDCGEIYFPTGFTPNGDNQNDYFGPLGNLGLLKNYELTIYNRWGQLVFQSTNPFIKWNGKIGNDIIIGTYVWFARFSSRIESNVTRKGTVVLVR